MNIRQATIDDLCRIAEIEIFNYRLNFYPIFLYDDYYFKDLQVTHYIDKYKKEDLTQLFVYDDGCIKGFILLKDKEVKKLFVEPVLQNQRIGSKLLEYTIKQYNVSFLWALEKNEKAISFYKRHGFDLIIDRKLEEDTSEYLICLKRDRS